MSKPVLKAVSSSEDADTWKARLNAPAIKISGHYAVLYWNHDSTESEVDRRLVQLNENFYGFFLWHATRGIVLPVPDKPLIAILAHKESAMPAFSHALDGLSQATDAFYSPDHNLLVLSPEPLDEVSRSFLRQNQHLFNKGFSRSGLLANRIPKLDHKGERGVDPQEVARANTLALVEKLLVDQTEIAAISYEGTRQLLFVTGVLPRHVTLPNWLTNGALNTFARPHGPAFVTLGEKEVPYMSVALSTGFGVPNYVLHRYFITLSEKDHDKLPKELPKDPVKLL
jgi:hypothetical protein